MSLLGIVLAVVLLMALAYRGVSVLLLAPLMALLAAMFSPGVPLLASYTQIFMPALGAFVVAFFPLFLLGAVFGKLMEDSGAARVIAQAIVAWLGARQAILAIVLACAVLTYGGVSLFVVAFAVYPMASALFREVGLPKRLIPGTIALGAFTFTMTALPGTPAIQNAIPMPFFGTTPFAAPGLGLIGGAVMLVLGTLWLVRRAAAATARGEGYGTHAQTHSGQDPAGQAAHTSVPSASPPADAARSPQALKHTLARALAPVVVVMVLNYLLATWLLPALDTGYLAEPQFGATTLAKVRGLWAVTLALAAAITLLMWLQRRQLPRLSQSLEQGATSAVMPLLNTASQVGFGAVIASLAGFALLRDWVLTIAPDNPLVSVSIAVNLLAGITGSASGGMSIALQTLGET